MDPKGKVALITGGARIGKVVAEALAKRGCSLSLTYRGSRDAAEATAQAARVAGVKATVLRADATNETDIVAAVNDTVKSLGRLDILINMAAIYEKTPTPNGTLWSAIQDANAKSAFMYSIHSAPIMKQNGAGRIVSFSDWLPVTGRPRYKDYVPYYVSKASVAALTEALALQLAPEVLVNAIAPGPILAPPDLTAEENAQVIEATPLARWGGAEEIAKTVMFFVETDFVTGEFIRVDGGRHLF
ncbi:SDR family NAD(P)-dependent oxidoreductase [Candidatus Binatus sp.]|uniref:SDR family NAD(P)-dependent oxidoreductase n=1 Tax=Candidatus Binatus sp. TaxID=2811406 RepID=UPI003C9FB89C